MKRLDILSSIEDISAEEQQEALNYAINHLESKFIEIDDLLCNIDLDSLDNILGAKNIAEETAKDLY